MCFVARFQLWAHMPFVKWVRGCLDRNSTTRYHKPRFGRMANIEDSITPCAHAITLIHLCRPDLAPIVAHIFPGIVCGLVAYSAKTLGLSDVDTISASLYQDDTWSHHQMETFSALLALCAGNSKGQWMRNFDAFFRAWTNGWVNNRDAGDLRRHCAHYDVPVMMWLTIFRRQHHCLIFCDVVVTYVIVSYAIQNKI